MPRTLTKEELNAIDELAARFAEGSHDLQSLSLQIQRAVMSRLLMIEAAREEQARQK